MSQSPGYMIDHPEVAADFGMSAARNDVLSEVLTLIRLKGELVYTVVLGGPWGLRFQPGPSHFYFVESGELWVTPDGQGATQVMKGASYFCLGGRAT